MPAMSKPCEACILPLASSSPHNAPAPAAAHPPNADGALDIRQSRPDLCSSPAARDSHWLGAGAVLPLLAAIALSLLLMAMGGDEWIADRLYAWEGGRWALMHSFLTEHLVHVAGKRLSVLAWLAVAVAAGVTRLLPRYRAWSRPLLYLALAVLLSTGLVSALKSLIHMDCPWDLTRYGGARPFIGLFETRPTNYPKALCFPAGHASAGYAWIALYFFFAATRPAWRWNGLAIGLLAGLVFGISQQLRGAHFASHDLWTLTLCWVVAASLNRLLLARRSAYPQTARDRRRFTPAMTTPATESGEPR